MADWRQNLKVGDPVIVQGRYGEMSLHTVARTTPTRIILKTNNGEMAFMRSHGGLVGSGCWNLTSIIEYNDKHLAEMKALHDEAKLQKARRKLKERVLASIDKMTPEAIQSFMELLDKVAPDPVEGRLSP